MENPDSAVTYNKLLPQLGIASDEEVMKSMTVEEKISLLTGTGMAGFGAVREVIGYAQNTVAGAAGTTHSVPRLGIPSVIMADGPSGLRISATRNENTETYYCTAFPIPTLVASSWDPALAKEVGEAMGREALEYGIDILLAPALNIQRNPLCGRNFEYFSEDPYLSGKIAAAIAIGIQTNGVSATLKHLAANNQETNRTENDVRITARALREIYLRGFRIAVKESEPHCIMTSYNLINGTYTSESHPLLTDILRNEWHFRGVVMTDWFGGNDATAQINAGNDLLMPGTDAQRKSISAALDNKTTDINSIDKSVTKILNLIEKTPVFNEYKYSDKPDLKNHAEVSRKAAAEGMVLLSNNDRVLPFRRSVLKIAVFGISSYDFISGGSGSGKVNNMHTVSLIEGLKGRYFIPDPGLIQVYDDYIKDNLSKRNEKTDFISQLTDIYRVPEFMPDSVFIEEKAKENDIAIITIGRKSGEFTDRGIDDDFNLSKEELTLIKQISSVFRDKDKQLIVILNIGGVVETASWKEYADAILIAWQPGQEAGHAVADILCGLQNPSGKLPMTFAVKYEDYSSSPDFPVEQDIEPDEIPDFGNDEEKKDAVPVKNIDYTCYNDDIYVGYRYFDTFHRNVSFPFGFGLSYTSFSYNDPVIKTTTGNNYIVSVTVTNTGKTAGKEIVQLYISAPENSDYSKPAKELKGFAKTELLNHKESQTLSWEITPSDLASFNEKTSCWVADKGEYSIMFAASSADIRKSVILRLESDIVTEKVNNVMLPSTTLDIIVPE